MEIFFKKLIANISFLMLRVLDGIMDLFSIFTGLETSVTSEKASAEVQGTDILTFFMEQPIISKIFISVLILSVVLLALFTIIAFIKSFVSTKKKPAKIAEEFAGAFLAFFLVQIILFGGIMVSNRTLQLVNDEFIVASSNSDLTLSQRIIDISVEENGWRTKEDGTFYSAKDFNPSVKADKFFGNYVKKFGLEQSPGYEEITLEDGTIDYKHDNGNYIKKSKGMADLFNTNLFILFGASAIILVLLFVSLIELARRLFDILFLYICMPMSVSTIPLDDGAKFKSWKDAIISKILAVYGTVIAINLYIMFLEILGNGINIGASPWVQTLFNIVLMIGGALAASGGARLFGQLIGAQNDPGRNLGQTIYTGMMAAQATGGIAKGVGGILFGRTQKGNGGAWGGGGDNKRHGGLFRGVDKVLGGAGRVLFGNRYTNTMNKGKAAYNNLKETLKGGIMNNGGIAGMAGKALRNAGNRFKGRPTGEGGMLGPNDLKL